MNFTKSRHYNYNYNYIIANSKKRSNKNNDEAMNTINQEIIDSIIDDNEENFSELITKSGDISDTNRTFMMTNYKLPRILSNHPTYASLCAFFSAEKCLNILSMLFPAGLGSEEIKKSDDFGRNPIHFACAGGSLNIIRELDQSNYSFDERDNEGCLPSHYAAMAGNLDVFKYLWTKGADLISSSNNYDKLTPLHVASLYGNLNIVKFICETVVGENIDHENDKKCDDQNQLKIINFGGFNTRYCKYSTPFHLACEGGHEDVLRYLLSKKELAQIQINSLDRSSRTPLLVSCRNGSLGCLKALIEKDPNMLKSAKNRKHIPLIDAVEGGYLDIVSFLLKHGEIDINAKNSQKLDAITVAVKNGNLKIVKCLVENGALKKFKAGDIGGLFLAACGSNNIDLVKYIDSVSKVPYFEKSNHRINKWISSGRLSFDENTKWGTQFLQQACMLENADIVTFLTDKGVTFENIDLSINTSKKWTSFMDFLVTKGVDLVNAVNGEGAPPIVSTIKSGSLANVKKILKKGAVLDAEIISKYNCILNTCRSGKKDLFDFLMSYHPQITNAEECVEGCISWYSSKNTNAKIEMAETLLKSGFVDVNKSYNNYDNESLVSRAISHHSFQFLKLFQKYGADFTNIPLRFDQISTNRDVEIVDFLKKNGCTFDKIIKYKDRMMYGFGFNNMDSPLAQSFYLMHSYDYNSDFPVMLVDYISQNEVERIKEGKVNVVDNFMFLNRYDGVMKLFEKCGCVVYPAEKSREEFVNWVNSSNNSEMINLVAEDMKKK